MPRSKGSLLEMRLDTDTLLRVVQSLDSYSVISFLEAFPRFKAWTLIITDHHNTQPLFFRVSGVERVHITDPALSLPLHLLDEGSDWGLLAELGHRVQKCETSRPIRLFEFSWMDTDEYVESILPVTPSQEKLAADQPFYFNSTSFVFLFPNYYRNIRPMDALTRRLDEFTDAKWHVGWSPYLNDECIIINKSLTSQKTDVGLIKNLCLTDVPVLKNIHLPQLQRLSLIYHETRAPVVRGIVAPELTKLIVHYSHHVPQFSEMSIATEEQDREYKSERDGILTRNGYWVHEFYRGIYFEELDDLKVFELAHIGSMTKGTPSFSLEPSHTTNDFSFLTPFQIVHLFGVPDSFFHSADLSNMWKLRWDIVDQPHLEKRILAPNLANLSLVVRYDGINVPSFNLMRSWGSAEWHIMLLGHGINISDLWKSNTARGLYASGLCIYNSPRLLRRNEEPVFELGYEAWVDILRLMGRMPSLKELELICMKLPFLTSRIDDLGNWDQDEMWGSDSVNKVVLRPVVDIQRDGNSLSLSGILLDWPQIMEIRISSRPTRPQKNIQFVISPFLVNKRDQRNKLSICYPFRIGPLISWQRGYELSRTLSISLGEEVSSLRLRDGPRTALVNLSPDLQNYDTTFSISQNHIVPGAPNPQLAVRLRRGRDMECDWFFYAVE